MVVHLKQKRTNPKIDDKAQVSEAVAKILQRIEDEGEPAVMEYACTLDKWTPGRSVVLSPEEILDACNQVPDQVRRDIDSIIDTVKQFASKQLSSLHQFECLLPNGLVCGQKLIPLRVAGCYVPGGRFAHVASAVMSCATAQVAGVSHIVCCSPPSRDGNIHPAIVYAAHRSGAEVIMCLGGVQAIGAMAHGLFTGLRADILVGPGNRFVSEAKRILFGKCAIDILAGPTEILIVADKNADAELVAVDLVSQAEHGFDSPAWLVTDHQPLAEAVLKRVPELIELLPEDNAARVSWPDWGEVVLCSSAEEMVSVCDQYAPEHLEVLCDNLSWWHEHLRNYGSLFLGHLTTVTFGDKCSGPNHILPTGGVANYSGGLNVLKFVKVATFQRMADPDSLRNVAPLAARISRLEGMEGHARSADIRLAKQFPTETFQLSYSQ